MGNGISDTDRVNISPQSVSVGENTFEISVTFSYLIEADTGAYNNCSSYITLPPSLPYVITSDSISGSELILLILGVSDAIKKLKLTDIFFCSSPSSYSLYLRYPRSIF